MLSVDWSIYLYVRPQAVLHCRIYSYVYDKHFRHFTCPFIRASTTNMYRLPFVYWVFSVCPSTHKNQYSFNQVTPKGVSRIGVNDARGVHSLPTVTQPRVAVASESYPTVIATKIRMLLTVADAKDLSAGLPTVGRNCLQ